MKVTACKNGKRYHLDEQEYQQLNGKNHRNGLLNKILIGAVVTTLVGAVWSGIIQIPALKARLANTEQEIGCMRVDVNALIITNTALKTKVELFLDGQKK